MENSNSVVKMPKVEKPRLVKSLKILMVMHDAKTLSGGDVIVDRRGIKYVVLAEDKVWNEYPHLLVKYHNGRVSAMSALNFPITLEV